MCCKYIECIACAFHSLRSTRCLRRCLRRCTTRRLGGACGAARRTALSAIPATSGNSKKKEALAGLLDARHARRPAPSERRRARRSSIRIRACVGDQRLYEVHVGDQQDCGCRRRFNTEGRATDRCFEHGRRRFDRRAGDRVQLRARVV